ncbi:MAG: hypothetical protein VW551_03850 [Euryarchaeota archaeon]|jgi:hypothetical protein
MSNIVETVDNIKSRLEQQAIEVPPTQTSKVANSIAVAVPVPVKKKK